MKSIAPVNFQSHVSRGIIALSIACLLFAGPTGTTFCQDKDDAAKEKQSEKKDAPKKDVKKDKADEQKKEEPAEQKKTQGESKDNKSEEMKKDEKKSDKKPEVKPEPKKEPEKKADEKKKDDANKDAPKKPAPKKKPQRDPKAYWPDFPNIERDATGEWWKPRTKKQRNGKTVEVQPRLLVPREEVVAFALYTHDRGVLKLTAQLYPLKPDEDRTVRLEMIRDGKWKQVGKEKVHYPGWSAHFRIENWDNSESVKYRVLHGKEASFEGLIRRDPSQKEEIIVGNLSCNSSRTPGPRPTMIENIKAIDPDLLFFAGDQSYHHTEHTFGWIEFGMQFRDVIRDRPTITIPDDHDVGQANIWGENGKKAATPAGPKGGFFYPAEYVNMVQRCQTWHLPDPYDKKPIDRDISVYFTNLRVGGIDFAILEDRKFKSGPEGKIPKMGPRPDHINDPKYDRDSIDVKGLVLLGDRQLKFLNKWSENWSGADMKCVLSQTAFCGAVHIHGDPNNRLLADLDCNGWPQTGRNKALREIRRAWAPHLCGDQHLSVMVKHGIDKYRDGPYAFTSPAIVNTIYGRWWHPEDEKAGGSPLEIDGLPWTGDYEDGLGNLITMMAYANPEDRTDEKKRADGFGICRFNKPRRTMTVECWPRFAKVADGESAQFPGWPITIRMEDNDGRVREGFLPEIIVEGAEKPVFQVIEEKSGEVLYTVRAESNKFRAPVYSKSKHTVKIGADKPDGETLKGLEVASEDSTESKKVKLK